MVILNKKILGNYTEKDPGYHVMNWLFDIRINKEIMKLNFPIYLVGLEFLIHRHLAKELEKFGSPLQSINWEAHNKLEKIKNILTAESNKHLNYLLHHVYTFAKTNTANHNHFYLFLASLILNENKRYVVNPEYKVKAVEVLIENYKEWGEDENVSMSEDGLLSLLFSVF